MTDSDRIPQVLVVDDEPNIRELVQVALKFHGCSVTTAATGRGRPAAGARPTSPDLIVLDVMLPDIDGFEVCRRLRAGGNEVPVIFLTARDTTSDTVTGLAIGGDDYVTKPFSVEALVARVRAVLRRGSRAAPERRAGDAVRCAPATWSWTRTRWTVHRAGIPVELSPTEFRLLAYLMRNEGRVLTRAQLLENVWGWDYAGQSQVVETYVSYLRRKLDPLGPPLIHTQRGVGYSLRRLAPPADERRLTPAVAVAARPPAGRLIARDGRVPADDGAGQHRRPRQRLDRSQFNAEPGRRQAS